MCGVCGQPALVGDRAHDHPGHPKSAYDAERRPVARSGEVVCDLVNDASRPGTKVSTNHRTVPPGETWVQRLGPKGFGWYPSDENQAS
jgi:hypothetical protein